MKVRYCGHLRASSSNNMHDNQAVSSSSIKIALTREKGENNKLWNLLKDLECIEIPCIGFERGQDYDKLASEISKHDTVILTSPQAADVFLEVWKSIGRPKVQVATVGKGTSKVLQAEGIQPVFEPSDATGECLSRELPLHLGPSLLYPSSSLADNKLVAGLTERGLKTLRLNTYNTVPAAWSEEDLIQAKSVDIVTFASPSTIKVWAERVGTYQAAVVIGPTSEKAAKTAGFNKIYAPSEGSKGIEPWAQLVRIVSQQLAAQSHPPRT